MSKREDFFKVSLITDDDCGLYRIGELDFPCDDRVALYIHRYGEFGYSEIQKLAAHLITKATIAIQNERMEKYQDATQKESGDV